MLRLTIRSHAKVFAHPVKLRAEHDQILQDHNPSKVRVYTEEIKVNVCACVFLWQIHVCTHIHTYQSCHSPVYVYPQI